MQAFLSVFGSLVLGALSGFDRLVFRGHLRRLTYPQGMNGYLAANHVPLKDFKAHALERTDQLRQASLAVAEQQNRPIVYLNSSRVSKEDEARRIADHDRVRQGLICVFKAIEPCRTYEVHRNRTEKILELRAKPGKCLFLYHYQIHPEFGFMHARIQTWYPFAVQVCLNGREWLARQMDRERLSYQRRDNKFLAIKDFARAQALLDQQLRTDWPKALDDILRGAHPAHPEILGRAQVPYYWSVYQSEWATDVLFRDRADLDRLFPQWMRHAMATYGSTQVLRFLGRKISSGGPVHHEFEGQVVSKLCRRPEGVCVKHWAKENSVKMYDCDRVLRIETTINEPHDFKVYRTKETEPEGDKDWRVLRKGVADLHRRAEVSQAANDRYAAATAAMAETTPLKEVAEPLCERVPAPRKKRVQKVRKVRGLNPLRREDGALLEAVNDPKFVVNGLRNRDLVAKLYKQPARTEAERRRRSARATRQIRLLRAHGLLHKVQKSHRYQVTEEARKVIVALLAARNADAATLTGVAA